MHVLLLDAMRGLAALAVLAYHLHDVVLGRTGVAPFGGAFAFGHRGVDVFFVLSGFVITLAHLDQAVHAAQPAHFLLRRAIRVFPSLWILSLAAAVIYAAGFGGAEKTWKLEPLNVVASLLLLPQEGAPLLNVSWTLVYEMAFYTAFAVLLLSRPLGLLLLGGWQVATLSVILTGIDPALVAGGFYLNPRCLGFGVGVLAALLTVRAGRLASCGAPIIMALGLILLFGSLAWEWSSGADQWGPVFLLLLYLGAGCAMLGGTVLERAGRLRVPRPLVALGEASYSVYLVHFGIITLLISALSRSGIAIGWVEAVTCGVFGLIGGEIFHLTVDMPLQRFLKRLLLHRTARQALSTTPRMAGLPLPRG